MIGDFKNAEKYAVSRRFVGDTEIVDSRSGVPESSSGTVYRDFCDEGFQVVGTVTEDGTLHVSELMVFDGESVQDKPWCDRYLLLKKRFDWGKDIRLSRHIVVKSREEFRSAIRIFEMLPFCEGVVVKPYDEGVDAGRALGFDDLRDAGVV